MSKEIIEAQDRIFQKIDCFFNFSKYNDFLKLNMDAFLAKYGSYGFSFQNFLAVRFDDDSGSYNEICKLLSNGKYFLLTAGDHPPKIFEIEKKDIESFLTQNELKDIVIMDEKMTWLLVYDRHRVLSGMGNYIKKKMKQNINLRFGDSRIMFTSSNDRS